MNFFTAVVCVSVVAVECLEFHGDKCYTPKEVAGSCIAIRECPELFQMLRGSKEQGEADYVRKSQCGWKNDDPMVCCPNPGSSNLPAPTGGTSISVTNVRGSSEEVTDSQPTKQPNQKADLTTRIQRLPYDVCGKSDIFKPKLDGSKVTLGAYPWMAALGYTGSTNPVPFWRCAGILVTDQFVLTVAQCLDYDGYNKLTHVRLGELDLDDNVNDGAFPLDVEVEKNIIHEGYNRTANVNDIGLVKLKRKVQFDYTKMPICIPPLELYETSFVGYSAVIAGWGKSEFGGPSSTTLNEASVNIQDFESCKQNYTRDYKNTVMDERVLCASSPSGDACQGDAGVPLMMYRKYQGKHKMFVIGLVSWGVQCGREGFPGVYTNVSSFYPWIIKNLELNSDLV